MAVLVREARVSFAFVERNINLTRRYWGWEVVFITYSIAGALSVLYIGRAAEQFGASGSLNTNKLILYLTVGALVWSYLSAVFDSISETISYERWEGTIEYTMMAPVFRVTHLLGASVFSVLYGLVRTAVILVGRTLGAEQFRDSHLYSAERDRGGDDGDGGGGGHEC